MRVSDAFPSNYVKAADLQDKNVTVVMSHTTTEKLGDDEKLVLYFQGKDKGLVLNKTNANNIAAAYGDETDDWTGKEIVLFPAMVDFQGRTVAAIRVRPPRASDRKSAPRQQVAPQQQRQAAPPQDDVEDPAPPRSGNGNHVRGAVHDDMNDSIPF